MPSSAEAITGLPQANASQTTKPSASVPICGCTRQSIAFMARGMNPASARDAALQALSGITSRQAQVIGFDRSFALGAILMLALLPLVLFLKHPEQAPEEREAAPVEP